MFKKLLMILAVVCMATSAYAYELPLDNLGTGWDSQYDPATHTITYEGAWTGRGWWLDSVDLSAFDKVVVEIEPATITAQLVVEYNNDIASSASGLCSLGDTSISVPLDPEGKASVKQIYIQCGNLTASPTLVLNSADVLAAAAGEENVLWQGSYTATGWNAGAKIMKSQVKAGDVLLYFMTPGDEGAQVIVKGADWSNLIGTSKIVNSSIINGMVQVIVTQDMLDKCGGEIFLQGDGGITCTMVMKAFELDILNGVDVDMLNGGTRILPAEVFINIPEDAPALTLVLNAVPEWLQICNQSWEALISNDSAVVTQRDDLVLMTFPLTQEIIAAINSNSTMVINGDANAAYICSMIIYGEPNEEPLYRVGLEDNASPFWTAWSPTYTLTGNGTIEFEFVNYSSMLENWDNWLAVLVNADVNPVQENYTSASELLVVRCDNWAWGPLADNTTFENDYNWDNFKADMNGSYVCLTITRQEDIVTLDAEITSADGEEFSYITTSTGMTSDILGVFLTTEFGHLDVYNVEVNGESGICDITAAAQGQKHFYNLNGIEVPASNLNPGLYIVKQGAKTTKVIVR